MRLSRIFVAVVFCTLAMTPTASAQTVTGSITGTVVDPGDAVVVGAQVHLTNQTTKQVREFLTAGNGTFTFTDLVPGDYGLRVTQPGFKTYVQNGITVGTLEKGDVHNVRLEVGDVSTSVEVQAQAARVATDTSDHATDINLKLIEQTPIRGRNWEG